VSPHANQITRGRVTYLQSEVLQILLANRPKYLNVRTVKLRFSRPEKIPKTVDNTHVCNYGQSNCRQIPPSLLPSFPPSLWGFFFFVFFVFFVHKSDLKIETGEIT